MGKAPLELAGGDGVTCTAVACHPSHDMVAAGFSDGMVVLADIASQRIIPVAPPATARCRRWAGARRAATWRSEPRRASPRL